MDETSTPTTAPEATTAPESQASQALNTPPAPLTREDRKTTAAAKLKEFLASKSEARKAEFADPKPAAEAPATAPSVEKVVAKIEKAGGEASEQKDGESDAKYEMRLAKQYRELRQANEKASKFEGQATEMAGKVAKFEKLMADGKANPLAILEHLGISFADVVKGINEDKYKPLEKKLDLPPEVAERLERLDRAEKAREEQALAASRHAERASHETQVASYVTQNADEYPLTSALPGFAASIVEDAYASKATDIIPLLEKFEASLAEELMPMLSSEKVLTAMISKNPALKAALVKSLGLESAPAAPAAKTTSVGSISTEPGTPVGKMSKEQRIQKALAAAKAAKSRG
jgi:hypothetical protein